MPEEATLPTIVARQDDRVAMIALAREVAMDLRELSAILVSHNLT